VSLTLAFLEGGLASAAAWRILLGSRVLVHALRRRARSVERVLVLGSSPLAETLVREIAAGTGARQVIARVAPEALGGERGAASGPAPGPPDALGPLIDLTRPDRIVVAMAERRRRLPVRQLLEARARGIFVEDGVSFYERLTGKVALESLAPSDLLFGSDLRPPFGSRLASRALGLLVSLAGILLLAPVFVLVAVAIKLDSRGPVFFIQERSGERGRRFRLIKFRTMHPAGGAASEWVRDNDGRITRVGRWLRAFRLDELPQFVNVLKGDMNLVGPRPHPATNVPLFRERIPYYALRETVRPGITGWSQVRYGYANSLEEETEKMRYDLYYIKHASLWLDLRILLDTVKIVLLGRGSSHPLPHGRGAARPEPGLGNRAA